MIFIPFVWGLMQVLHVFSAMVITPCFAQGGIPSPWVYHLRFLCLTGGYSRLSHFKFQPRPHVHYSPVPWTTRGVGLLGLLHLFAEKLGISLDEFKQGFWS